MHKNNTKTYLSGKKTGTFTGTEKNLPVKCTGLYMDIYINTKWCMPAGTRFAYAIYYYQMGQNDTKIAFLGLKCSKLSKILSNFVISWFSLILKSVGKFGQKVGILKKKTEFYIFSKNLELVSGKCLNLSKNW